MSRKKKLVLNTMMGIVKQLVMIVCALLLPRYMLVYYGSAINGLISSMTHFLSFISLLDMGVGSVIIANFYEPLAKKNHDQISCIVCSSEKFFKKLSYIFLVYIVFLCVIFPTVINQQYQIWFSISLLVIVSISIFAQSFFGMTYTLLLNADQKAYVQLTIQVVTIVLNTILSVILMSLGYTVHIVILASSLIYLLRPIAQIIYVRQHYQIDYQIVINQEPIKQKWNGFSQHLAAVVSQNVDVVVLTIFSTLKNVSIYAVYYNVAYGMKQAVITTATGIESLFGNMLVNQEMVKLKKTFDYVEWLVHTLVTIVFTVGMVMMIPFITLYTHNIADANYILPVFGTLLVMAYGTQCLRIPYFMMIKAAGHFKETQNGAYLSAMINVVITVALVIRYGLVGAAIGTLASMFYHTCYFAWYLKDHILKRPIKVFIKYIVVDSVIALIVYSSASFVHLPISHYSDWCLLAFIVLLMAILISFIVNFLCYRYYVNTMLAFIQKKLVRITKNI